MNGKEILVDTNIILHVLKGTHEPTELLQGRDIYVSFISELELLGYKEITSDHEKQVLDILEACTTISMNNLIKKRYIEITRKYTIKLPDAIIAATALAFDLPFITADKGFSKITELKLITFQASAPLTDKAEDIESQRLD